MLSLIDLSNDLTGVIVRRNILPELIGLKFVDLTVLVGVVVGKDPLGVLLQLELSLAGLLWSINVGSINVRGFRGRNSSIVEVIPRLVIIIRVIGGYCLKVKEGVAALRNSEVTSEQQVVFLNTTLVVLNIRFLSAVIELLVNDGKITGSEPNPFVLGGVLHSVELLAGCVVRIGNDTFVNGVAIEVRPESVYCGGDGDGLGSAIAGVSVVNCPVDLFVPAVSVVLLLSTIGFPSFEVAVEAGVELDGVLNISPCPQLLGSVAWEVVGGKLSIRRLGRSLELGGSGLGSGEGDSSRNH